MSISAHRSEQLASLTDEIERITEETDFNPSVYLREIMRSEDDYPDNNLSTLTSLAETLVRNDIEIPGALKDAIDTQADILIEETTEYISNQLAVVALASAFHFTGNERAMDAALKTIAHPHFDNETSGPVANAVHRVAMTGMSVSDSLKKEKSLRKSVPDVSSPIGFSEPPHIQLGPEYEYLYDPSLKHPRQMD